MTQQPLNWVHPLLDELAGNAKITPTSLKRIVRELASSTNTITVLTTQQKRRNQSKPIITKEKLFHLYFTQNKNYKQITRELHVSTSTICKAMQLYGFKARPSRKKTEAAKP